MDFTMFDDAKFSFLGLKFLQNRMSVKLILRHHSEGILPHVKEFPVKN